MDVADLDGDGDRGLPDAADLGVRRVRLSLAGSARLGHGAADAVRRDQPAVHDLAALRSAGRRRRIRSAEGRRHRRCSRTIRRARASTSPTRRFAEATVAAVPAVLPMEDGAQGGRPDRPRRKERARHLHRELDSARTAGCRSERRSRSSSATSPRTSASTSRLTETRDYVRPVFGFNTTEAGLGSQFGLLGFADDNWVDGTQTFVFAFDADVYRSSGYGFTGDDHPRSRPSHRHVASARRVRLGVRPRLRPGGDAAISRGRATRATR